MITGGRVSTGDRLPAERTFAQQLGVSRTTLREALHELEMKGLVSRRPGRGTIITEPEDPSYKRELTINLKSARDNFREVMELRAAVEPGISGLAAKCISASEVDKLSKLLDAASSSTSAQLLMELDAEFHAAIADATGNSLLRQLVRDISALSQHTRRLGFQSLERRNLSWEGHRLIVDALRSGDSEAAERLMKAHLESVVQLVAS